MNDSILFMVVVDEIVSSRYNVFGSSLNQSCTSLKYFLNLQWLYAMIFRFNRLPNFPVKY